MDRQALHVASTIPRARAAGVDWLLHIDDDELLFCPGGLQALWATMCQFSACVCDAHLHNIEALACEGTCSSPYLTCTSFVVSTARFSSYTNGKSFGRLSSQGLRAHGPHHFRGDLMPIRSSSKNIPPYVAVVLHYESCTFERWLHKFRQLADRHSWDARLVSKLPFSFYRESLDVMHRLSLAEHQLAIHGDAHILISGIDATSYLTKQGMRLQNHVNNLGGYYPCRKNSILDAMSRDAFTIWARRKLEFYVDLLSHEAIRLTTVRDALGKC
mmetsp:Transcript_7113/g.29594  ORF Transcript_7113/g.29594 Transcript_7113/m.29594 type:complete len:272 (-) Transcript_7113:744-1559(-)